ncbi:MAG: 3,4-dihydroxy-2-butanone-4-phosphate synthase [Candidatus Nanopelagicales bacterium]
MTVRYDEIESAISALRESGAVIIVDENEREIECDLVFAAELATPELMNFMVRNGSGVVGVALPGEALDRLAIPPMTPINQHTHGVAMSVAVDSRDIAGNGASAADRAITARALANPQATRSDFVRPGYVFPYRAQHGGVLRRGGGSEAAMDLVTMAGLQPAAVLCELVNEQGALMTPAEARDFADVHALPMVSIKQLIAFRMSNERAVTRVAEAELPTDFGPFHMIGFSSLVDGSEHVALVAGDISDGEDVLVRVHAECLLGDVVDSQRCQCAEHLHESMRRIQAEGRGALVYVRSQPAQGSGLLARLAAYQSGQDMESHMPPTDPKNYGTGSQILKDLGIRSMRLLTATPSRQLKLEEFGLVVNGLVAL